MINRNQLLSDYATELDQKEKELIAQKRAVREFLKNPHNEKATQKYIEALEETETRMEDIMGSLLDLKAQAQFRQAAEKLCKRCEGLDRYTNHMNKILSNDLAQKKRPKIDWVKNATFLLGLPISFFLAVKNGLLHNHITPEQATITGAIVSSGVLAIDKITQAFKMAGKAVCWSGRKVGIAICTAYAATKTSIHNKKVHLGQKSQRLSANTKKKVRKILRRPEV